MSPDPSPETFGPLELIGAILDLFIASMSIMVDALKSLGDYFPF